MRKLAEKEFTIQDGTVDPEDFYEIVKKSYLKNTGKAWSFDDFMWRAENWVFYGNEQGAVAVRPQRSGPLKLTAAAGNPLSVARGFKEILATGKPVWGAVDAKLREGAKKLGMISPPAIVIKNLLNSLPAGAVNAMFSGAHYEINDDGSITIDYPGLGRATKFFICNKAYLKWLLTSMGSQIGDGVKKAIQALLIDRAKDAIQAVGDTVKSGMKKVKGFLGFSESLPANYVYLSEEVWQTDSYRFGSRNRGGHVRYFTSRLDAENFEKTRLHPRDRAVRNSVETKISDIDLTLKRDTATLDKLQREYDNLTQSLDDLRFHPDLNRVDSLHREMGDTAAQMNRVKSRIRSSKEKQRQARQNRHFSSENPPPERDERFRIRNH